MFNILNGGKHAQDSTDFQEFMVMPVGVGTYADALRAGSRSSGPCAASSTTRATATGQGDEGGFAPSLPSNEAAVELILRAIEKAGYRPGVDVAIALDPATERAGRGRHGRRRRSDALRAWRARVGRSTSGELIDLWADWAARFPIVSLRTVLARTTGTGWRQLTERLGDRPARRRRPARHEHRADRRGDRRGARTPS
jgi:enolase